MFNKFHTSAVMAKTDPNNDNLKVLKESYCLLTDSLQPLLLTKNAEMITKLLKPLYDQALTIINLEASFKKKLEHHKKSPKSPKISENSPSSINDESNEGNPILERLKEKLDTEITKMQDLFEETFKKIEVSIDNEGKKLFEIKFGTFTQINGNLSKFFPESISEYGLQSLQIHEQRLLKRVQLLKQLYIK